MEWFGKILCRIEDGLHALSCLSLALIAVLINADIISRLLLKTPLTFQFEAVEIYLMPMVATLSLARVFRDGGHLSLEIIHPDMFGRAWPAARTAMLLIAAIFTGALAWKSGQFALRAILHHDVYFGFFDWPLGWAYSTVPLGTAVLTIRLLFDVAEKGSECVTNH